MTSTNSRAVHFWSNLRSSWLVPVITEGVTAVYIEFDGRVEAGEAKNSSLARTEAKKTAELLTADMDSYNANRMDEMRTISA